MFFFKSTDERSFFGYSLFSSFNELYIFSQPKLIFELANETEALSY